MFRRIVHGGGDRLRFATLREVEVTCDEEVKVCRISARLALVRLRNIRCTFNIFEGEAMIVDVPDNGGAIGLDDDSALNPTWDDNIIGELEGGVREALTPDQNRRATTAWVTN